MDLREELDRLELLDRLVRAYQVPRESREYQDLVYQVQWGSQDPRGRGYRVHLDRLERLAHKVAKAIPVLKVVKESPVRESQVQRGQLALKDRWVQVCRDHLDLMVSKAWLVLMDRWVLLAQRVPQVPQAHHRPQLPSVSIHSILENPKH